MVGWQAVNGASQWCLFWTSLSCLLSTTIKLCSITCLTSHSRPTHPSVSSASQHDWSLFSSVCCCCCWLHSVVVLEQCWLMDWLIDCSLSDWLASASPHNWSFLSPLCCCCCCRSETAYFAMMAWYGRTENDRYDTILHNISRYDTMWPPNTTRLNEWQRHIAAASDHTAVSTDTASCDETRSLCQWC